MKPFPLQTWLERNGMKAYTFARRNGMHLRSVYAYCAGEQWERPNATSLLAIEAGTNGEVTMREMLEWCERKRAEVAAQEAA